MLDAGVRAWLFAAVLASLLGDAQRAGADYGLDVSGGVGTMITLDQRILLGLEQGAYVVAGHGARTLARWAGLRFGARYGNFHARGDMRNGQLLSPELGLKLSWPAGRARSWVALDLGPTFTGSYVRPGLSFTAGVDFELVGEARIGPVLGYGQVVQWNDRGRSQDAGYVWCGVELRVGYLRRAAAPAPPPARLEPASTVTSQIDDGALLTMVERALPMGLGRTELLALVLFDAGQDRLTPSGVAMLHEVARTLRARSEVELVCIEGYADAHEDVASDRPLALRRAENVRAWLVAHGIAAERLSTRGRDEAEGADATEGSPPRRRIVFRITRIRKP